MVVREKGNEAAQSPETLEELLDHYKSLAPFTDVAVEHFLEWADPESFMVEKDRWGSKTLTAKAKGVVFGTSLRLTETTIKTGIRLSISVEDQTTSFLVGVLQTGAWKTGKGEEYSYGISMEPYMTILFPSTRNEWLLTFIEDLVQKARELYQEQQPKFYGSSRPEPNRISRG